MSNRKIDKYGLIEGGNVYKEHANRRRREQGANICANVALTQRAIIRDEKRVYFKKGMTSDMRLIAGVCDGDTEKQVAYFRVMEHVIKKRIGTSTTWVYFRQLIINCTTHSTGWNNHVVENRIYHLRKKAGEL